MESFGEGANLEVSSPDSGPNPDEELRHQSGCRDNPASLSSGLRSRLTRIYSLASGRSPAGRVSFIRIAEVAVSGRSIARLSSLGKLPKKLTGSGVNLISASIQKVVASDPTLPESDFPAERFVLKVHIESGRTDLI